MNNLDLQSENRKDLHFHDLTGSAAARPAVKEIETVTAAESAILISGENGSPVDIWTIPPICQPLIIQAFAP